MDREKSSESQAGETANLTDEDAEIKKAIEDLEKEFAGNGRVLIRPSGTEPLVRVMIEGKDINVIEAKAKKIANMIEKNCK